MGEVRRVLTDFGGEGGRDGFKSLKRLDSLFERAVGISTR
jgi:hypothetical protein